MKNFSQADALPKSLRRIAVDLTPVLPGGENGGAKIFVLELLKRLASLKPETEFVLLTNDASHQELAVLDQANVHRAVVLRNAGRATLRAGIGSVFSHVIKTFPPSLRRLTQRVMSRACSAVIRRGSRFDLRAQRVDLLFCPFTAPTYYEPGIPTVSTLYDLQYKSYPQFFDADDVRQRDYTFTEACRRASVLITISDYTRDTVIVHGKLNPTRVHTIYLRMAQRITSGMESCIEMLDRLGLEQRRYLIYPANFWKHKNHEMLLTSFGLACRSGLAPDAKLVCTGAGGARRDWLQNAAQRMGLGERVLFPGYLSDAELAGILLRSGGLIFPSLYEGFGLPVIEAMAAGVPVACSNTTSLPEVASDAALLFDPRIPTQIAEAICSLMNDQALRARLAEAGHRRALEFADADRMAAEYWNAFQDAIGNEWCESMLAGAHADGWAGARLSIHVAPGHANRVLEMELSAPEWIPQSVVCAESRQEGGRGGVQRIEIRRGASALLTHALNESGGYYQVILTPTFVPAHSGLGGDQRELSVMLKRCNIVGTVDDPVNLYPERLSS